MQPTSLAVTPAAGAASPLAPAAPALTLAADTRSVRWARQPGGRIALRRAIGTALLTLAAANVTWVLLVPRVAPAVAAVVYAVVAVSVLRSEDYRASVAVSAIAFVLHLVELVRGAGGTGGIDGTFLFVNTLVPLGVLCLGVAAWRSVVKRRDSEGDR